MRSHKRDEVGIAIESKYLDEVQPTRSGRTRAHPVSCPVVPSPPPLGPGWAGKRVTLSVPAATVAKLFADGILPVVGTRAVAIEPRRPGGPCLPESVEPGEGSGPMT